ncbi:MAG: hypothetical protein EOP83_12955, partial [Verrucomicrobiaceae bacterium]
MDGKYDPERLLFEFAKIAIAGKLTASDMNDINVANIVATLVDEGRSQDDAANLLRKSANTVSEMVVRGREAKARLLEELKRAELFEEELRKLESFS